MVPPTVKGIRLPHPVSTVECSAALNHQFDTPCVLRPCNVHLCADAVLLAGFTSHHDGQFLTYLEGHWQTPSSLSHRLYSAHHPYGNPSYSNLGVHSNSAEHRQHHAFYSKAKSVLCSLGSNQLTVFCWSPATGTFPSMITVYADWHVHLINTLGSSPTPLPTLW